MKRPVAAALFFGLLFAEACHAEVEAAKRYESIMDGSGDRIVRSAFVPSDWLPQGEVRLLRRGEAVVMQTVLNSRYMKRVVTEIRNKESASWPVQREGHADSLRYVAALTEGHDRIQRKSRQRKNRAGRRQKLLIEFILSGKGALVAVYEPELAEEEGHYRVTSKNPVAILESSRAYVRGNIFEIAWDALGLSKSEAKKLLDPMLPREPAGKQAAPAREGSREHPQ
jgi:hypothetical protein